MKKTIMMKKAIALLSVLLMLTPSTGFSAEDGAPPANDEQFIFIVAYPGNLSNSTTSYVSGIIEYNGYDACSKDSYNSVSSEQLFSEAGRKFLSYLESEYGLNKSDWQIQFKDQSAFSNYPSGYFKGYETKAKAQYELDSYLRNNDRIKRTSFTYKCLVDYSSKSTPAPVQNKAEGKAWWCTYYLKGTTMYLTKVYNNDCNHCQNEISAAFVKWLILNDYDHQAITSYVVNLQDVNESDLDERREEKILWYKQKGYNVIKVSFTYTEN